MILIVAEEDDLHALSVAKSIYDLDPHAQVAIFDSQDFPSRCSLELGLERWTLETTDGRRINSDDITALWWRRPSAHDISKTVHDPTARNFCANESAHAFRSIAYWPTYKVINDVEHERRATHKPLQHYLAHRHGLSVPDAIVTNSPSGVLSFYEKHKEIIYKVMTTPISLFAETRRFVEKDKDLLHALTLAPVIFQKEVRRSRDIRATVVGDRVFAATVKGKLERAALFPDWRLDPTAECQETALPVDLEQRLLSLVRDLGLRYAAIDLIEDGDGRAFFLEANPSGQFLFVEIDTGQQISKAFAELLLAA